MCLGGVSEDFGEIPDAHYYLYTQDRIWQKLYHVEV